MDALYTWVDGEDPVLTAKRESYLTGRHEDRFNDIGGRARYANGGELYLSVASLLRFAPFIDRIFVITDGQDPGLDQFLARHFPESPVQVFLVDHKDIFRGYESYLPVFNSLSIETLMWQIPALSEDFLYLNDDFFLVAPCTKEDFFRDGKVVSIHRSWPVWVADFLTWIRPSRADGKKRFTYKDSLRNGALRIGSRHYFHILHTPMPLRKSVFARYYAAHPEDVILNISHRFRDNEQYNNLELCPLLLEREGALIHEPSNGRDLQLRPSRSKKHYMRRKLREIARMKALKYVCMNDLDACTEEDKRLFWEWASALVGVPFKA